MDLPTRAPIRSAVPTAVTLLEKDPGEKTSRQDGWLTVHIGERGLFAQANGVYPGFGASRRKRPYRLGWQGGVRECATAFEDTNIPTQRQRTTQLARNVYPKAYPNSTSSSAQTGYVFDFIAICC